MDLTGRSTFESVHKSNKQSEWTRVDETLCILMNIVTASLDQPQFSKLQPRLNPRWPTILTDPGISIEEPPARLVARTRDSNDSTHAHDLPNNLATLESVPALKLQLVETIPSPMNILMSSWTCFKTGVSLRMKLPATLLGAHKQHLCLFVKMRSARRLYRRSRRSVLNLLHNQIHPNDIQCWHFRTRGGIPVGAWSCSSDR